MEDKISRLLSKTAGALSPYVPGEQPTDKSYIKLNTNESPYPPSQKVDNVIKSFDGSSLSLYPDPTSKRLNEAAAKHYGISPENVFSGGGSDEVLGYAFYAFSDRGDNVYFPDITYGFYKVYANFFSLQGIEIPLKDNFEIDISKFFGMDGSIFIANPNAPTGIILSLWEIEEILKNNQGNLVVVDEAYIDFADAPSAVSLIDRYDNLLVVQTFSKSRALAGMRLGFGFGSRAIIEGLERVKFSFNPYNIDRISCDVGIASLSDQAYFEKTVNKIKNTRDIFETHLESLGFSFLKSSSNFVFARHKKLKGEDVYNGLRDNGVLVRHFPQKRISDYVRITIGTKDDMEKVIDALNKIVSERG